jgi:hypothetical protein
MKKKAQDLPLYVFQRQAFEFNSSVTILCNFTTIANLRVACSQQNYEIVLKMNILDMKEVRCRDM